jgi:hypothetical protein
MNGFLFPSQTKLIFDGTNLFTLTALSSTWSYWRAGVQYTITGNKTATLTPPGAPVPTGKYFIYIDATDGTLTVGTVNVGWTLMDNKVPVAMIYFNNGMTPKFILTDERHTCLMDMRGHANGHYTEGTKYSGGGALSGWTTGGTNILNCFGIAQANIFDEDLYLTLSALADPNGTGTPYRILYRVSASAWAWKDSVVPLAYTGAGRVELDSGTGLTAIAATQFVNYYLCFTNAVASNEATQGTSTDPWRYVLIPGRTAYTTAALALGENFSSFNLSGFPFDEIVAVWRIIYDTTSGSGAGLCHINSVNRVYANVISNTISSSTSHEGLTGLQGGTTGEHLHLTAAELTIVQATSGTNTGDQTGGTPALTLSTANTAGASTNFIRRDDTIAVFDATSPTTQALGDAAAVGSAAFAARRDHKHAMPVGVNASAGAADSGKIMLLSSAGIADPTFYNCIHGNFLPMGTTNSPNQWRTITWTASYGYSNFTAVLKVVGRKTGAFHYLFVRGEINSEGTAWGTYEFRIKDMLGQGVGPTYRMLFHNSTKKAVLYFLQGSGVYEEHAIVSLEMYYNGSTVGYENADIGASTTPAADFTVTPTTT